MERIEKRAEVVIIGGGVIGTSIAYNLARRGCRDVVILERESIGSGSTGRGAGGIRQQFSTAINIKLSIESIKIFKGLAQELECEIIFHQRGYLFLATSSEEWEIFNRNVALQRSLGVEVELLTPEEAKGIIPALRIDDLKGATYCGADGYSDPHMVCQGYVDQAKKLGVKIYVETEALDIKVQRGHVWAVETNRGIIKTSIVVNAAGPYAGLVGDLVGVKIPVKPFRRQIFVTAPFEQIDRNIPLVVDFHCGFYFRKEGPAILMGMADKREPSSFKTTVDWNFLLELVEQALHRVPLLAEAQIMNAWAGLYENTLDAHPILGRVPGVGGFICAVGFSGHGFMHAPIVGRLIAELIVNGEASTLDISPLSIERFAKGEEILETQVI